MLPPGPLHLDASYAATIDGGIRLHHRRGRLRRLRAGQPPHRERTAPRAAPRGRRQRCEPLDPRAGRLCAHIHRSALQLDVPDGARACAGEPHRFLAARQGVGRVEFDQCHAVRARAAGGLRRLARRRQSGLGMAGRVAVFPQARGSRLGRFGISRRRRAGTRSRPVRHGPSALPVFPRGVRRGRDRFDS